MPVVSVLVAVSVWFGLALTHQPMSIFAIIGAIVILTLLGIVFIVIPGNPVKPTHAVSLPPDMDEVLKRAEEALERQEK
jgi:hypothetical protein